ncbi:MATE family efflux transporter [Nakamurella flavida]|uniref:MATE family efflux transporter n=1 Tax=Nakamurella flavida TaxID=363630 RepID=A0A939C727_9ACTN|nr:MATE family efflux transporter [Nakamurella flavida]MBM9477737.1 MATE family efflux transporter [Nakamurella flavida]MDP9779289.1 putative MATE family efflux protein [Nakamurella flavida]
MAADRSLNREILRLAVPALGALLAEPAFLLVDAAIVGHLGTDQLAGVGVASVVLATAVGLAVFLAYGTTAQVARSLGAGDPARALEFGVAGLYLAAFLGLATAAVLAPLAPVLVRGLGAPPGAAGYGTTFLLISVAGLPAMLVVLAATGVLRGLQDTRTPLWVAAGGAAVNVALNVLFVLGFGWGVAGSAVGTVITQYAMAAVLVTVVRRAARQAGAGLRPHRGRITGAGTAGIPLFVRTLTLRLAIVATTVVAARQGVAALAAHQVLTAIWNFLALGLDALAIAAQALTGRALGQGNTVQVRRLTGVLLRWGLAAGAGVAVIVLALSTVLGGVFSPDPTVRAAVAAAAIMVALGQPLSGWVFVLDGVLIGAGDGRYLAWAGVGTLVVYLPATAALVIWPPGGTAGLVWLWVAFTVAFMGARALTLGLRLRSEAWLVTGA